MTTNCRIGQDHSPPRAERFQSCNSRRSRSAALSCRRRMCDVSRYAIHVRLPNTVYHWARVAAQHDQKSRIRYVALRRRDPDGGPIQADRPFTRQFLEGVAPRGYAFVQGVVIGMRVLANDGGQHNRSSTVRSSLMRGRSPPRRGQAAIAKRTSLPGRRSSGRRHDATSRCDGVVELAHRIRLPRAPTPLASEKLMPSAPSRRR